MRNILDREQRCRSSDSHVASEARSVRRSSSTLDLRVVNQHNHENLWRLPSEDLKKPFIAGPRPRGWTA